jgi:iron-sulfur cluster assembly protein
MSQIRMKNIRLRLGEGEILLDQLLQDGVDIAHDCGGKLACASCRVVLSEGLECLEPPAEDELDMMDRAGVSMPNARLACQVKGLESEILVVIPGGEAPALAGIRPVSLSARAAEHLAGQLAKHPRAVGVRLRVDAAGCSGFGYRIEATEALGEDDAVFEHGGVRLVVDAASLPYLQGTSIELADAGLGRRLRFDNPNARQRCGCGESFGV